MVMPPTHSLPAPALGPPGNSPPGERPATDFKAVLHRHDEARTAPAEGRKRESRQKREDHHRDATPQPGTAAQGAPPATAQAQPATAQQPVSAAGQEAGDGQGAGIGPAAGAAATPAALGLGVGQPALAVPAATTTATTAAVGTTTGTGTIPAAAPVQPPSSGDALGEAAPRAVDAEAGGAAGDAATLPTPALASSATAATGASLAEPAQAAAPGASQGLQGEHPTSHTRPAAPTARPGVDETMHAAGATPTQTPPPRPANQGPGQAGSAVGEVGTEGAGAQADVPAAPPNAGQAVGGPPPAPLPSAAPASPVTSVAPTNLAQTVERIHALVHVARANGIAQARLELHPQELGAIQVRIRHTADGVVATMTAERPEALQALQQAGDDLRRHLEQRGTNLLSLDVGLAAGGQGQAREQRDPAGRARAARAAGDGPDTIEAIHDNDDPTGAQAVELPAGVLVDVRA